MAKCKVMDLNPSDSDSDADFIQAKKAKVEPNSPSPRYRYAYFTGLVHVRSNVYCSLAKSGRLICIGRSWEFRFAMLTSVRAK